MLSKGLCEALLLLLISFFIPPHITLKKERYLPTFLTSVLSQTSPCPSMMVFTSMLSIELKAWIHLSGFTVGRQRISLGKQDITDKEHRLQLDIDYAGAVGMSLGVNHLNDGLPMGQGKEIPEREVENHYPQALEQPYPLSDS
jgi:hypothetical protein